MSLQNYLTAKSNKGKTEQELPDLIPSTDSQQSAKPNSLHSPKKPSAVEEDYSSGAKFWSSARLSDFDTGGSSVAIKKHHGFQPKAISRTDVPNENSVANLLRKIKITAENSQNSPSIQKTKSDSFETLKEESSTTISQAELLLESISQQIERKSSEILVLVKNELQTLNESVLALSLSKNVSHHPDRSPEIEKILLEEVSGIKETLASLCLVSNSLGVPIKEPSIDRPTKSLISSILEKLIMISKTQDHEFASINQRILQLEKRLMKPNQTTLEKYDTISSTLTALESKLGKIERDRLADIEKLEKLIKIGNKKRDHPISPTDDESYSTDRNFNIVLQELKDMSKKDQQISQDQMSQFMELSSVLKSIHENLLNQVQIQAKSQSLLDNRLAELESHIKTDHKGLIESVKAIHETIVSYLPLNLESKILSIESLLKFQH